MTALSHAAAPRQGVLARLGNDTLYLLLGLPTALLAFMVVVTGLSVGASLAIVVVGVPLVTLTLVLAGWFAAVERLQLPRILGHPITAPPYRRAPAAAGLVTRTATVLRDPQRWLDAVHALLRLPVAVATWSLTVVWWPLALGGLSYPLWWWVLPDGPEDTRLHQVLGLDGVLWDWTVHFSVGLLAAVTLPWILRGCAIAQAALSRELLANERVVDLQQRVTALTTSRDATRQAEASARHRLERDLHDGPQQRLVRLAMDLAAAEQALEHDPEAAKPLVASAVTGARETLDELRTLVRGIAPPVLTDRGLEAALTAVAARSPVPVALAVDLHDRPPARIEEAVYYVVSEALSNVAKHAAASRVEVTVFADGSDLWVTVGDDGRGGARQVPGHGLAGLADRVRGLEGTLSLDSPPGGPTRLTVMLPCG